MELDPTPWFEMIKALLEKDVPVTDSTSQGTSVDEVKICSEIPLLSYVCKRERAIAW
jgi:hypothetical protein